QAMSIGILLAAIVVCVVFQAFFAASEIALVAADDLKVRAERERGDRAAAVLNRLLERRDRIVAMMLTGNNLATVVAAAALTSFLHAISPRASLLAPFILAPVSLLLGESLPKMLVLRAPLPFARVAARPLSVMATTLAPLLIAETALSRLLRRMAGVPPEAETVFMSREDLAMLVRRRPADSAGAAPGPDAILPAEQQMISRIFRFSRVEARQAMVPLVRVEAVPDTVTIGGAIELVRREGFTRIPVFHDRIFDIVGVLHAFDLLEAPDLSRSVAEVMRPVSYFPEATPLDEILIALQRTRETLAVVVDEYGGASGIITMEDLLEEVVGDIEDEHDVREELARVAGPRTLVVSAQAGVADLNERFSLNLPEHAEYATIGGLVVERLGHIPKPGEQLRAGDVIITVARSDARAVREVVLHLDRPLRLEPPRRR
ncbi:MAG TPA: hemolysin family protein, partial [Candidatus Binataceae bacterium]|nr:hemolysin family protein [Candidatus Binataceae bacterium]